MMKRHVLPAVLLASIAFIAAAAAEEFPSRPITWVVPFAPGGITDTTSRIVAEEMSKSLGQSVLIDNRAGAGGTVGTEQVARARPDGYPFREIRHPPDDAAEGGNDSVHRKGNRALGRRDYAGESRKAVAENFLAFPCPTQSRGFAYFFDG